MNSDNNPDYIELPKQKGNGKIREGHR